MITPIEDAGLTLAQRLEKYDPARHGGEVMVPSEVLQKGARRARQVTCCVISRNRLTGACVAHAHTR
jgi:hypothetical protein